MNGLEILQDLTHYLKYARFIPQTNTRESYSETVNRYLQLMKDTYPKLSKEIDRYGKFIYDKKVLPSMRMLQFAGRAIQRNHVRGYNCSFLNVDDITAFQEVMFLLLSGTGVGYSVQSHHISKLPKINKNKPFMKFLVPDTIEGWADAIGVLVKGYTIGEYIPKFDFSEIRPAGVPLKTSGGKAPGPEKLKQTLIDIESILSNKKDGDRLTSIEVHDIMCYIADCVLSGGIRRAAMIALFDKDDKLMLTCKSGEWWKTNPQRARANNSVVLDRGNISKEDFDKLWTAMVDSNSGEPGFYFTNDINWGTNPCAEIALQSNQFCNLTEINGSNIESQEDFLQRIEVATFFGTLQAGFTDFHYLRPIWSKVTKEGALLGVGITGIASGRLLSKDISLEEGATYAVQCNLTFASMIGINPAQRVTTVKPSGTTSLLLGTSSGIHSWHSKYFIRRVRISKLSALYKYLVNNHTYLIEDDIFDPHHTAVISLPVKSPEGAITRDSESVFELLNRVEKFNVEWVKVGHRKGVNTNNVSTTISVKPEEWGSVKDWVWINRNRFNGISFLPYDTGTYQQAPFEKISQKEYIERCSLLSEIDFSKVIEVDDNTDLSEQLACSGGSCEI